MLINTLAKREQEMRLFLLCLPHDADKRAAAIALTKLDELVMWAKQGIDK